MLYKIYILSVLLTGVVSWVSQCSSSQHWIRSNIEKSLRSDWFCEQKIFVIFKESKFKEKELRFGFKPIVMVHFLLFVSKTRPWAGVSQEVSAIQPWCYISGCLCFSYDISFFHPSKTGWRMLKLYSSCVCICFLISLFCEMSTVTCSWGLFSDLLSVNVMYSHFAL